MGKNKTAIQISDLFGIKTERVYRAAISGYIVAEKYRIEFMESKVEKKRPFREEDLRVMADWDDVTEKARAFFRHIRQKRGVQDGVHNTTG